MHVNRKELSRLALAGLIAFAVLFFCTKSSFGYPINDWADANIYLSIGKGMTQGQVVYRDLYDHKGPLLYALHALCALISFDFTGVFVMEVVLAAAFVYIAQRFCRLMGLEKTAWLASIALAVLVYTSFSFAEGDSAEEMALPLIMGTMYGVWAHLASGEARMEAKRLILHGFLAGCVFWIKFTMIGLHAGLLLAMLIIPATERKFREMFRAIGWLIAGFALSTLPWVIYFGLNGAIGDWLKTYLYDNLFLYGSAEGASLASRVKDMLKSGLAWFAGNLRYAVFIPLGLLASLRMEKRRRLALWLMTVLGALCTFIGGKSYIYYGLVLAPAALYGLASLIRPAERLLAKRLAAALCALCLILCPLLTQNPDAGYGVTLFQPRETTMQHRIAAVIRETESPSLLNYGFMDAGFFTAAGIVPQVKYFHQTNVPLEEMLSEQIRYIEEGLCDYVVARGTEPECIHDRYELVATEPSPNFWYENVHLYRLKR